MGDNLNVLHRAGHIVRSGLAVALPERQRRMAGIAGLNVLAVGLAFAALQIGGAIVSKNQVPSIAAIDPGEATAAAALVPTPPSTPIPHRAPPVRVAYAATPDRDVLFSDPVVAPSSFGDAPPWGGAGAFVQPASLDVPPPVAGGTPPIVAPPVAPVTTVPVAPPVAVIHHHKKTVARLHAKKNPRFLIARKSLDVEAASDGEAGASSAAVGIGTTTGLGVTVDTAASVAGGVASGVGSLGGTAASSVGSVAGAATSSVGSVAGAATSGVGTVAGAATSSVGSVASSASAAASSAASAATGAVGGAVGAVGGVAGGVASGVGVGKR